MNILIIGASQGTGALAAKSALDRGHNVTAFSRNPDKLALQNSNLKRLPGNFHDASSVDSAVAGHDAVIITASATSLQGFKENPAYFSQGTGYVIDSMRKHKVRRLVVLSALGVGESVVLMNFVMKKLIIDWILKGPFKDHAVQERLAKDSGLDWVIARPGRLTDGPALGKFQKKTSLEQVPSSISRADVADFLIEAAEKDTWKCQAVQLGG